MIVGWRYYNHAVIPTCAPHEEPDTIPIVNGQAWVNTGGTPLLARWTSDWDCDHETNWWYVIKDTPFDKTALKSKRRYEINKGNKNFDVRIIDPSESVDEIYRVTVAAYTGWPEKYRPIVTFEQVATLVEAWSKSLFFAAYQKNDSILQGYAVVKDCGNYAAFSVLRVDPEMEKWGINAAIVDGILREFHERLHDGFYICDGERSIRHETAFQDYLEKYFAFRKAFCKLNMKYRPGMGIAINVLYPFRRMIRGSTGIGNKLTAVLKMEEICRETKKRER